MELQESFAKLPDVSFSTRFGAVFTIYLTSSIITAEPEPKVCFCFTAQFEAPRHFVCVLSLTVFTSYYVKELRLLLTASYAAFPGEKRIKRCRDGHKEWIVILQMSEGILFAINKGTTKYTFFSLLRTRFSVIWICSNLVSHAMRSIIQTAVLQRPFE